MTVGPGEWRTTVALEGSPNDEGSNAWLALERARVLRDAGEYNAAQRALEASGQADSIRVRLAVSLERGRLLKARGESVEERLHNLDESIELSTDLPERRLVQSRLRYTRGVLETQAGASDKARPTLETELERVRGLLPEGSLLEGNIEARLAELALTSGDLDQAETWGRASVATLGAFDSAGDNLGFALSLLGLAQLRAEEFSAAIEVFEAELRFYQGRGLVPNTVYPLFNIGIASERLGDFHRSDTALEGAEQVADKGSRMAARIKGERSYLYISWGRLNRAAVFAREAHDLLVEHGVQGRGLATSFARLGHVARYRGTLDEAEDYYLRAIAIYEEVGSRYGVASNLSNLGNLERQRKDFEAALALYLRAVDTQRDTESEFKGVEAARLLSNVGRTLLLLGRVEEAEGFLEESLALKRAISPRSVDVAASLMLLGDLERSRNKPSQARQRYEAALDLHTQLVPGRPAEAENQIRLGQLLLGSGDVTAAESLLVEAVATTERRVPGTALAADAFYQLARVRAAQGRGTESLALYRRAVDALDSQWETLGGTDESRLSWMHVHGDYYRALLESLVEAGRTEEAFELLQRFRARVLRRILAQRDFNVPRSERAEAIEVELVDLAREREALLETLAEENLTANALAEARADSLELRSTRSRLLAELRVAAPALSRIKDPAALSLDQVAASLEEGTTMLSFSVGQEETLVFIVRGGASQEVSLVVERLPIGRSELGERVGTFRQAIQRHLATELDQVQAQATAFYDTLFRAVDGHLTRAERILVIPDGPLHGLPFAALRREGRYLVEFRPLHIASSATVHADLGRGVTESLESVALGDPAFEGLDEAESATPSIVRGRTVRGVELRRLPGTRDEVEAIKRVLPPPVRTLLGREATEESIKQLTHARFVHLASHAVVNEDEPLNSVLALSLPAEGAAGENGLLYAWEVIEQMSLSANLVTLSACETGLGRESAGEGIVGLVWAFHNAGARSVLASLWNVEDRSTSDLMAEFYTGLAAGLDKDEALRRAQLHLIGSAAVARSSQERGVGGLSPSRADTTEHPFYWAGFQLYGSTR